MKDAFGKKFVLGDKVIYSVGGSAGTTYVIGEVVKLYPCKPDKTKSYYSPDRVMVKPITLSSNLHKLGSQPILYASNVVAIAHLPL